MIDVSTLRSAVSGVVLTADDAAFADEVSGFNLAIHHRPDVVVGVASTADVVAAVTFAREHGLHVSVQSTGHGAHAPVVGGMLITTRRLDSVSVEPEFLAATVGAGARWGEVIAAAAPFGLAPITGSSTSVGAVGYLLGGGLGPLARSHGFSSDYVREFELVTADGEVLTVDELSHPDLFWALRGGKGGFGVVTSVRLGLVQVDALYAGSLVFEGAAVEPALRAWRDFTDTAPDDVTTSAAIFHFPPIPDVPEVFRGKDLLMVRFARPGDAEAGAGIAAPLRSAAPVYLDQLGPMQLADVGLIHNDRAEPGPSWGWGQLLGPIDDAFLDVLLAQVGVGVRTPFMIAELRHVGAASAQDVAGGSAVGGRDGQFALTVIGAPDPSLFAEVLPGAAGGLRAAIEPWLAPTTNIHWDGAETETEYRRAWPSDTFDRLAAIRAQVDPAGTFAYGPGSH